MTEEKFKRLCEKIEVCRAESESQTGVLIYFIGGVMMLLMLAQFFLR